MQKKKKDKNNAYWNGKVKKKEKDWYTKYWQGHEQLHLRPIAGTNVIWHNHFGEQLGGFLKS